MSLSPSSSSSNTQIQLSEDPSQIFHIFNFLDNRFLVNVLPQRLLRWQISLSFPPPSCPGLTSPQFVHVFLKHGSLRGKFSTWHLTSTGKSWIIISMMWTQICWILKYIQISITSFNLTLNPKSARLTNILPMSARNEIECPSDFRLSEVTACYPLNGLCAVSFFKWLFIKLF